MPTWIPTASGKRFYPLEPLACDVDIADIAHHLANECRFTGATRFHYSVAQHSVLVSKLTNSLWGLLHDSAEAYLRDLPKPLKNDPAFTAYKAIEQRVMRCIATALRLPWPVPRNVKLADEIVYATECRDVIACDMGAEARPLAEHISEWTPRQARTVFLARYNELTKRELGPFLALQDRGLIPSL